MENENLNKDNDIIKNPNNWIICSKCKELKHIDAFNKDRTRARGIRNNICKMCKYKAKHELREKTLEELKSDNEYAKPDFNELFKKGEGYTCAIFGSSRSGKTTFLTWLYKNYLSKNYDIKIMFSTNSHIEAYKVFKENDGHLLDKFNNDLCLCLHNIQKKTQNYYNICLLMDDEINQKNNKTLKNSFVTWRNANISTFVSLQSSGMLDKHARNCIHRLVLMKINNEELIDLVDRLLISIIPTPNNLYRIYDKKQYLYNWYIKNTSDYNFIIIDMLDNNKIYKFKTPL